MSTSTFSRLFQILGMGTNSLLLLCKEVCAKKVKTLAEDASTYRLLFYRDFN